MSDITFKTELRRIGDLVDYEANPRKLSAKAYRDLKRSLSHFSLAEIPVINTDNTILAGHQRIRILKEMYGDDIEIEVRVPSRVLTAKEEKEYLIRSNQNHGSWDTDILAGMFELEDLEDWGFPKDFFEHNKLDLNMVELAEVIGSDMKPKDRARGAYNPTVCCPACQHVFKVAKSNTVKPKEVDNG